MTGLPFEVPSSLWMVSEKRGDFVHWRPLKPLRRWDEVSRSSGWSPPSLHLLSRLRALPSFTSRTPTILITEVSRESSQKPWMK